MADKTIPAPERLVSWVRDYQLWDHVEEHLEACSWPRDCPHPLCGASVFDKPEALRYHLVDEHRFGRKRAKKPVCSPPTNEQPQQSPSCPKVTEVSPRKRKQTPSAEALQWVPSDPSSSTCTAQADESVIRRCKRHRPSPPAICPAALSLQEDWVGDNITYSALPSPLLSNRDSYEDGSNRVLLKRANDLPSPRFMSPGSTSVTSASYDDEILFSQYLRSPSHSPVPSTDCASSESSEATLVALPQHQSCEKPTSATSVSAVHEGPTTRHEGEPSHVRSMPRIRFRVSQPKITLRLSVPRTSRALGEEGNTTKRRRKQQSREESRGAKSKGTTSEKAKGRKRR